MLKLKNLSIQFDGVPVLQGVEMNLNPGETLAVIGKSGSGKTTLLKILAGLQEGHSGSVLLNDEPIDDLPPQKRGIVYLYQEPLLFPHLTVRQNIGFGLKIRKAAAATIKQQTEEMIRELQLKGHEEKYPGQLSGGQKQRVAFGRALIIEPKVMLLDEPFGSLDPDTRADMQQFFQRMRDHYKITALFVTHDVKEALIVGDRFARMDTGRLKDYRSRELFINDEKNGIEKELEFWKNLKK